MAEKQDVLKHRGLAMFSIEARVPVFRSEPPAQSRRRSTRGSRGSSGAGARSEHARGRVPARVQRRAREPVRRDGQLLAARSTSARTRRRRRGWAARPGAAAPRDGLVACACEAAGSLARAVRATVRSARGARCCRAVGARRLRSARVRVRSEELPDRLRRGRSPVATESCSDLCEVVIPSVPLDQLAATACGPRAIKPRPPPSRCRRRARRGRPPRTDARRALPANGSDAHAAHAARRAPPGQQRPPRPGGGMQVMAGGYRP